MTDRDGLSDVISRASLILSVLGPNVRANPKSETEYADCYSLVLSLMREHGVRRIFALSTVSVSRPEDGASLLRWLAVTAIWLFFNRGWRNVVNVGKLFENEAEGVDWTVFRVAGIPGGADADSWRKDRGDGETFVGWVGKPGWSIWQRRGALARWLVDAAEGGAEELVGKMPAVSRRSG